MTSSNRVHAASWTLLIGSVCLCIWLALSSGRDVTVQGSERESGAVDCSRIVSLAPSITEVVKALDLQHSIVGATRYCAIDSGETNNSDRQQAVRVGGYLDVNLEAVVGLKPSVTLLLKEHQQIGGSLRELGVPLLPVDHQSVEGILASIRDLGTRCGAAGRAQALEDEIRIRMERITAAVRGATPVTVLLGVGRVALGPPTTNVYISGRDGYYSDILTLAGGRNVFEAATVQLPNLSAEGVLALDPEVIIEIVDDLESQHWTEAQIKDSWKEFPAVRAVRSNRVEVLSGRDFVVPGPQFVLVLERFARLLHPDRFPQ